ncbi:hypothetical protein PVAG01_03147 [Phlyctema vagabunda]|uniref:Uncharacterized protein n=1 Tax=Phlyctema vagabunda TaxID=108571 RepID=A0ABR4PSW3_9HELO
MLSTISHNKVKTASQDANQDQKLLYVGAEFDDAPSIEAALAMSADDGWGGSDTTSDEPWENYTSQRCRAGPSSAENGVAKLSGLSYFSKL